ncbi:MAG: malectin domain-containing carbohydrate-binding protein [Verrucomicrobiae bacterium]|nr:malectin domain-containing carbohydrate-binding protein [Verrucomicrobiae bacterium]
MNTLTTILMAMTLPLAALAADVTGTWKSEFDSPIGRQKYTFAFKQDGTNLTGKANSEVGDRRRESELQEGKIVGDTISFVEILSVRDNEIRIAYTGRVSADGNEIRLTRRVREFPPVEIVAIREQIPGAAPQIVRIKAGRFTPFTDSKGNVWLPDQGFEGGDTVEHDPPVQITGTDEPGLFQSERYSMESFTWKLPNGKYVAKLYFCETYDGITGPGERVFSFNVQGHEFRDFDVWVKAGGPYRPYILTVPVEVTKGEFRITFTPKIENPQINAIEIIPESLAGAIGTAPAPTATATAAKPIRIKAGRFTPYTDSDGNTWLPDHGFDGGETVERDPSIQIANTKDPELFRTERYLMDAFTYKLPNGSYIVKLYFAETYEGIGGPGDRVFSFNVQGKEFKDFDIWVKAGGPYRAYIETVSVEVTNRELKITFTPGVQNPAINAIEIIPVSISDMDMPWPGTTATNTVGATPAQFPQPSTTPVQTIRLAKNPVLYIDAGKVIARVNSNFYGLMTEEINFSYEGGLYAELIRNRTFKASPQRPLFWDVVGEANITLDTNQPLNKALDLSLRVDIIHASKTAPAGIANGGYWGIPVRPNTTYRASFWAKSENYRGPVTLAIESVDGKRRYAQAVIPQITSKWQKYTVKLKTRRVNPSKDGRFVVTLSGPGTAWFQNVSLFPPTYRNRPNGLRPDIMHLLAELEPKFLRFPGGNYLEGNVIEERFNWKETIGPVEERPGHRSPWGYWSTDGMGLLEFLLWCKDLGMEPVLGVYAGYSLRQQYVKPGPDLEPYVQDALDEIEYIIGDPKTTKWGAQRARHGHPQPFPLRYVEIGNEDFFDRSGSYEARFAQFYDAIKAKYPHLQIISTMRVNSRTPDLVDDHFYFSSMEEAMASAAHYDSHPRAEKPKVFVGEWATRVGSPTPNMAGALGDAAWMTGLERNADIVVMHCYAPLFVNVSQLTGSNRSMQWASDLIGYDALSAYGSPAYYVQKMFSSMRGDEVLATDSENIPTRMWQPRARRGGSPPPPQEVRELFFSATRDSKSGVIYVKVVNTTGSAIPINIQIKGVRKVMPRGEAVVVAGESLRDTNTIDNPRKIVPRKEKISGLNTNFTHSIPPYSVTVLKLKTK